MRASVLISGSENTQVGYDLSGQFFLVGFLFDLVSISSAQPRFWLSLATDGAVGSSQFCGGTSSSRHSSFFPMKHIAWAMLAASPWRLYILPPAVCKWTCLLAWLWLLVVAGDVPFWYMADHSSAGSHLGDMLAGKVGLDASTHNSIADWLADRGHEAQGMADSRAFLQW